MIKNYYHLIPWYLMSGALVGLSLAMPEIGVAGEQGSEFNEIYAKILGYVQGVPGKILAVTSFGIALIGSVMKFNPYAVFGSLGVGLGTTAAGSIGAVVTAMI